jgi:hypothetical protein
MSSLIFNFKTPALSTGSLTFSSTPLELPLTSWLQHNHLHDNNEGQSLSFSQIHQ